LAQNWFEECWYTIFAYENSLFLWVAWGTPHACTKLCGIDNEAPYEMWWSTCRATNCTPIKGAEASATDADRQCFRMWGHSLPLIVVQQYSPKDWLGESDSNQGATTIRLGTQILWLIAEEILYPGWQWRFKKLGQMNCSTGGIS
jgi:hypothetical protein